MKTEMILSLTLIVLLGSCGRKTEFLYNAYVLADSCAVTQGHYGDSVAAGKLAFMDMVRLEEEDHKSGRARIESSKGIRGWIDRIDISRVPPGWKEVAVDDYIVISLPMDRSFTHVKNDAGGADDGELTEFKFFNADYFINLVRTDEPFNDLVARARDNASRDGTGGVLREIAHGGLTGYFYYGQSDMDEMPALTWIIRGDGRISYIVHVMLQKEIRSEYYTIMARHILFSAKKKEPSVRK